MEFNVKLQTLRKQKGLTQEELAEILFVSRTAISKWESGRGYPSIDSLKAIAKFFKVTIDELLSNDELLTIAEEDTRQKEAHFRDVVFAMLDLSTAILFFLPFFAQKINETIQASSLLSLTEISSWLKLTYCLIVTGMISTGVLMFALQNCGQIKWIKMKYKLSLTLNTLGTFLFIISSQPYAAVYIFLFLIIKAFLLITRQ